MHQQPHQHHRTARSLALLILTSSSLVLTACGSSEAFERGRAAGQNAGAGVAAASPTPGAPAPAPAEQASTSTRTLTGTGKTVEGPFPLHSGLVRVAMQYTGDHNFIVRLLDSDGKSAAGLDSLLANSVGAWQGEKAVRVEKSGSYLLDVTGEGPWQITITQ